jgi:hypothetical protein
MAHTTTDKLVALTGLHGLVGPTKTEMQQSAAVAKSLRLVLDVMLEMIEYQRGEDGPSILARMIAGMIWRVEHPAIDGTN